MNFSDNTGAIKKFLLKFNLKPKSIKLYVEALTHSSYANEKGLKYSYQRLEFLGDAVLQMYTTLSLFFNNRTLSEGQLTINRSKIVREETIAQVCKYYGLNELIFLGHGEILTGGREKLSILGDVFEAFVAAIYLDLGQEGVLKFLNDTLFNKKVQNYIDWVEDYKTLLQEYLQMEHRDPIVYEVINEKKENNVNKYVVVVKVANIILGKGSGISHSRAEQEAAKDAYSKLVKAIKKK